MLGWEVMGKGFLAGRWTRQDAPDNLSLPESWADASFVDSGIASMDEWRELRLVLTKQKKRRTQRERESARVAVEKEKRACLGLAQRRCS